MLSSSKKQLIIEAVADRICRSLENTHNSHVEHAEAIATPPQMATMNKAVRHGWSVNFVSNDNIIHMFNPSNTNQKMTITADGNYQRITK